MEDIKRPAEHGLRSVLITDIGVLSVFDSMRRGGELPEEMQAKISVMLPVGNPAAARVIQDLGANTINIPTDLTLEEMAAIRAAIDIPSTSMSRLPPRLVGSSAIRSSPTSSVLPHPCTSRSGSATLPTSTRPAGTLRPRSRI
jgi:Peptidase family U32